MKMKFKKDLSNKQIAAIAVFAYLSVIFIYIALAAATVLFPKAPEKFDFTIYENRIQRVDLVDFDYLDDYAVLETLDSQKLNSILKDMSNLWFYGSGFGDPPGFGGKCILLTFDDESFRVVCQTGYVHFAKTDEDLHHYTGLYRYIKADEYKAFLQRYFTSKLDY